MILARRGAEWGARRRAASSASKDEPSKHNRGRNDVLWADHRAAHFGQFFGRINRVTATIFMVDGEVRVTW